MVPEFYGFWTVFIVKKSMSSSLKRKRADLDGTLLHYYLQGTILSALYGATTLEVGIVIVLIVLLYSGTKD